MQQVEALPAPPLRPGSPPSPLGFVLQPVLARLVRRIAARHPDMFARLGPYQRADFLIVIRELPVALHLRPDPDRPLLRAVPRARPPRHDARIEGPFLLLLRLIDGADDGDAAFFARELSISGNTEAVVSLRNALDDIEGSIAQDVADAFGPPGRIALDILRRRSLAHA